ncbi:MAG: multidrug transporter, partial [Chlamydiota bacterium]
MTTEQLPANRKKVVLYYAAACATLLAICLLIWLFFFRYWAYTDDCYVQGNQIVITPLRDGFTTAIHSDDTFLATEGQLLVDLDRTDSLIFLEQSKERLAQTVREVCQSFHQVFAYAAEIKIKEAEYIRAIQDFEHRDRVIQAGGVSLEDYEHSVAALRASYFSLAWTEALYDRALALVRGTTIRNHPLVLAAADQVRDAWVQLYRTRIYSPVEGLVAQRKVQVGM